MGEGEGSGGGDGGAGGELPPVGGSKGPEPLASPNVLHWVGWLPGTKDSRQNKLTVLDTIWYA